jgi:hypothetical protein
VSAGEPFGTAGNGQLPLDSKRSGKPGDSDRMFCAGLAVSSARLSGGRIPSFVSTGPCPARRRPRISCTVNPMNVVFSGSRLALSSEVDGQRSPLVGRSDSCFCALLWQAWRRIPTPGTPTLAQERRLSDMDVMVPTCVCPRRWYTVKDVKGLQTPENGDKVRLAQSSSS